MSEKDKMDEKVKLRPGEMFSIIRKALKVSLKTKSVWSFIIAVLGFGFAFLPALTSYVLGDFTNSIQDLAAGGDIKHSLILFGVLAALFLINEVFEFFKSYSLACDGIRTNRYICRRMIDRACRIKYKYIENHDRFLEKIKFIDDYAGRRVANSIQTVISWLQNVITFVSVMYLLLAVNAWIVVILTATSIPAVILAYKQKDELYRHNVKNMVDGEKVMFTYAMTIRDAATNEVRQYRLFPYLKKRWRNMADYYINKKRALTKKHVLYNSAADALRNIVYIGVLLLAALEIYKNPAIGVGTFMLVFSLSKQYQKVTGSLLVQAAQFFGDVAYMKDFFDLDKLEEDDVNESAVPYKNADITFEKVDFTYPGSNNKVLKNINITIKSSEKIAIVGENGSGKTTFLNLLCGMYDPDCGNITIGGKGISDDITATRRSISVVFQNFGKYDTTLRRNITVSDPGRECGDDVIMKIAELCGIDECIKDQPGGLDEEIGAFSKKGNNLSGGQWQKLALARALYRDKAQVMVLDEPTAALDPIAEANIYRNFTELSGGKTTILVSHRLGITSIVDRILVFRGGEIVEDGSHRELLANNGYYAEMYRSQAQWYEKVM